MYRILASIYCMLGLTICFSSEYTCVCAVLLWHFFSSKKVPIPWIYKYIDLLQQSPNFLVWWPRCLFYKYLLSGKKKIYFINEHIKYKWNNNLLGVIFFCNQLSAWYDLEQQKNKAKKFYINLSPSVSPLTSEPSYIGNHFTSDSPLHENLHQSPP